MIETINYEKRLKLHRHARFKSTKFRTPLKPICLHRRINTRQNFPSNPRLMIILCLREMLRNLSRHLSDM